MTEQATITGLARDLISAHGNPEQLFLSLGPWTFKTSSNSPELIEELKAYFGPFASDDAGHFDLEVVALQAPPLETGLEYAIKEPDPGKTKIKEEYADLADGRVVRKRLTGMVFMFGGGLHLAVGPCLDNPNQVVNFINSRLIQLELDNGALLAHAAGVNCNGAGLALAGFSGMGKSTLALHMMSLGTDFVSNDRLLVKRGNGATLMTGVAKLPRINPGTALNNPDLSGVIPEDERVRFESLETDELWDLEHKYDVDIARFFGGGRFRLHSDMNALGILNWTRDGSQTVCHRVDLNQRLDLLQAFIKSPGLFFLPGGEEPDYSEQAYLRELEGVKVFELTGGVDFLLAAQLLLKEMQMPESETWSVLNQSSQLETASEPDKGRKRKAKQELGPDQAAGYLRQLADQLEAGLLNFADKGLELSGPVKIKEEYKVKPGKASLKLSLKLCLPAPPPERIAAVAAPPASMPEDGEAPEPEEAPASAAEPEEIESGEPPSESEDYSLRQPISSYKKLKKRMNKDVKLIGKLLDSGQLPSPELAKAFFADCIQMTGFPGKGDPYYPQFNQAAQEFLDAVAAGDAQGAARAVGALNQMKKDCHKEFK